MHEQDSAAPQGVRVAELVPGDVVIRYGRRWVVAGPDPGGFVALVEPGDPAAAPRVVLMSPIDWVDRVERAASPQAGVPYLWAQEPMEEKPGGFLGTAYHRAGLQHVMDGVQLGAYDQTIIDWLASWDTSTVATVVGWIVRARQAGPHPSTLPKPATRRLCAHADSDGEGMHWLSPGETCPSAAAIVEQPLDPEIGGRS